MKISKSERRALSKRQHDQSKRLRRSFGGATDGPVIGGGNIHYEVAERSSAINCGGIGVIGQLVERIGLKRMIDEKLSVLKRHLPYHESDHVLSVALNVLCGGSRLEDLEQMRGDVSLLNALGASRLPDPTTAGDFTRRFKEGDVLNLMEALNQVRPGIWEQHRDLSRCRSRVGHKQVVGQACFSEAVLDIDGTIAGTTGECKAGMGLSYKGVWGYGPLLITLANTREPLFVVNRPGNVASQSDAAVWLERAIELMQPCSERICLRGDSAFSLTGEFDGWSARGINFVFGYDAHKCLIAQADALSEEAWVELERPAKYQVATQPRQRPGRAKEEFVRAHGYRSMRLQGEAVAEFPYCPTKCGRNYRVIALRKAIRVEEDGKLFHEIRYFFYITNRTDLSATEVVYFINDRCDQENVIEQMKNGVHAMNMPVGDLVGNWAYMVMASLAWSIKAWYGLLMPNRPLGTEVVKMEFRRFLRQFIMVPCQIVRSGRRLIYRILGYNQWLGDWLAFSKWLQYRPRLC